MYVETFAQYLFNGVGLVLVKGFCLCFFKNFYWNITCITGKYRS